MPLQGSAGTSGRLLLPTGITRQQPGCLTLEQRKITFLNTVDVLCVASELLQS